MFCYIISSYSFHSSEAKDGYGTFQVKLRNTSSEVVEGHSVLKENTLNDLS